MVFIIPDLYDSERRRTLRRLQRRRWLDTVVEFALLVAVVALLIFMVWTGGAR